MYVCMYVCTLHVNKGDLTLKTSGGSSEAERRGCRQVGLPSMKTSTLFSGCLPTRGGKEQRRCRWSRSWKKKLQEGNTHTNRALIYTECWDLRALTVLVLLHFYYRSVRYGLALSFLCLSALPAVASIVFVRLSLDIPSA